MPFTLTSTHEMSETLGYQPNHSYTEDDGVTIPRAFEETEERAQENEMTTKSSSSYRRKGSGVNCWSRFRLELRPCRSYFQVLDSNDFKIDLLRSFSQNSYYALLSKLFCFTIASGTLGWAIYEDEFRYFSAYASNLALVLSTLYHILSLFNTVYPAQQPPTVASSRIATTWAFYELAVHAQIVVTVFWWVSIFDADGFPGMLELLRHGGVCVATLFCGCYIDRIPVRWWHWYGLILGINLAYIGWTILYVVLDVGPLESSASDSETDNNLLYKEIDWVDDRTETIIICVILCFALSPAAFLLMWLMSLYKFIFCCGGERRYYIDDGKVEDTMEEAPASSTCDPEEKSIFSFSKFW